MKTASAYSVTMALAVLGLASCSTTPKSPKAVELFNGQDLNGWKHVLADASVPMAQVWSVKDGILTCQGTPLGFIYAGPDVTDFRLVVEYRWAPGTKPGNSGIFSRIEPPLKPLPRTIETQLMHGNAGDVLGLQGKPVNASQHPRFFEVKNHKLAGDITGVKKETDAEKAPGEWNRVEILGKGPSYTVWVNGKLVNQVEGVDVTPGPVGLQSEGGVIEFRQVSLTPL